MKQLKVSGQLNTEHVKKLIKAFYRNDTIVAFDEENVSNTIKRKLANQDIDSVISVVADDGFISIYIHDSTGKCLFEKKESISDCSLANVEKFIYYAMCEYRGFELGWGTMTGVHPVRPVYFNVCSTTKESDREHFLKEYQARYLISDKKLKLTGEVARNEMRSLAGYDYKDRYSLYVGIPFCPTTCIYCSFTSYSMEKYSDQIELYLNALIKEIKIKAVNVAQMYGDKKSPLCVYIGGGTPTSLSAGQLDRLLGQIEESFDLTGTVEFCVEAGRPDTIDEQKLQVMKQHHVTRISVNPQTMNDKTLEIIGRRHSVEDIIRVYRMASDMGFDNINMDVIVGLPGEDELDARRTIEQIVGLCPAGVTVHTLAIKRAAFMNTNQKIYDDIYYGKKDADADRMVDITYKALEENGYLPYYLYRQKNQAYGLENTGFAKKGKECLYNILTMEELGTVIALGAGAVSKYVEYGSKISIRREDNAKSLRDYIKKMDEIVCC